MKKESMRRYSLLGLVLLGASAVTAAVLPKAGEDKQSAKIVVTNNGGENTCTITVRTGNACERTATGVVDGQGSRTSTSGKQTSSITTTNGGGKAVTRTTNGAHTSQN